MLRRLGPTHLLIGRAKASGCCCLVGDDLGHRPVIPEYPRLAGSHVSGGGSLLDLLPGAMSGETDHGIPNTGAGTASLAGRVRIGGRADRYSPSSGRVPRHGCCSVTPFADRLGPLIPLSLEAVPNGAASVGSDKHCHYGRDAQFGEQIRMCGIVGRQVYREPGRYSRSDEAPVLDSDNIVAEDRLVGEGDSVLAGVGGDELVEKLTVDLRPYPGRSPAWA
jgi:hypothetical protein